MASEDAKAAKTRRLAEALRANLKRRKAAGGARAGQPRGVTGGGAPDDMAASADDKR